MICERCGKDSVASTMSYFNLEVICLECCNLEEAHPLFEEAKRIETEAVANGNYNFPGIGLPDDLRREKGAT